MAKQSRHALIVLPAGVGESIPNIGLTRWLSRGDVEFEQPSEELLNRILPLLGHSRVNEGLAALRFWGQTGERSSAWMAAADPVHLDPTLNDLRLRAIPSGDLDATELREIFDDLQTQLGGDDKSSGVAFARIGLCGYLRSHENLATAKVSSEIADGRDVSTLMPVADMSGSFNRLLSELQMSLHDHEVNRRRESAGLPSINSVWFWGGGESPCKDTRSIPPLFSDDALLRGYWESCTGVAEMWRGELSQCLDLSLGDFVVVTPVMTDEAATMETVRILEELRQLLRRRTLSQVTILFRDGLSVRLKPFHEMKIWRGLSPFFKVQD